MKYCDYVNTKQGSDSLFRFSNGNTLPLCQLPFGMIAFAPQTDSKSNWYYHPSHRSFEGIRLTHQPSPWIGDHAAICFMPQKKPLSFYAGDRWSGFRPNDAILTPYYLKYELLRTRSTIEVTPTERCGKIRISFTDGEDNYFSVYPVKQNYKYHYDIENNILVTETDNCNSGERVNLRQFAVYKFPEGSVDIDNIYVQKEDTLTKGYDIEGENTAIHIRLVNKVTEIDIASSYISEEQAVISLNRESINLTFEEIKSNGEKIWEEYLSRIKIEAVDENQMKTFYSCMYRAFLYPHKCFEIDDNGKEIHYCPHDGKVYKGKRYTDNGFWDTYRTVYPFFSLVAKEEMKEMLISFINEYKESGWLPRWLAIGENGCMPSTLVDAVICDGAVKNMISNEYLEIALEGMLKHATTNSPDKRFGRNGAESYCKLGYVPYDEERESVNLTQDAAYGDWCIAEIAKILGKTEIEKEYRLRSTNYKNIFDKESGFMRAKDSKGIFRPDFTPIGWGRDYTEGSAWQNSFAVPHDMEGLAELYGGKENFIKKIDELFETKPDYEVIGYDCEIHEITEMAAADFGQCAISNQPSFHIPYIYSELGYVEKSAYWAEKLCKEAFSYKDDGFPGDEDNGTMAIWYIFSVMGFYPFCPGKPEFVKGKKQVIKTEILGKEIDVEEFEGNKIPYESLI